MTKIIDRSIEIAYQLFPTAYEKKKGYRAFHFAFGWKKRRLLAIGQNDTYNQSAKALWFAKRFNNKKQISYPFLHAEVDLISKLWGKIYVDNSVKVVVLRINSRGELQNSKPCKSCMNMISVLGIDKVWWSDSAGNIVSLHEQGIYSNGDE